MPNISTRLREERKRLGLSQGEFANLLGVHRNTQARYERGEREPDTSYLEAIAKVGVDVGYVLGPSQWTPTEKLRQFHDLYKIGETGESNQVTGYAHSFNSERAATMLLAILDIDYESWNKIVDRRIQLNDSGLPWADSRDLAWRAELITASGFVRELVDDASTLDSALLAAVLEGIESSTAQQQVTLPPAKKAQATTMLYRSFKASGKVDPAMVEEAVKLAAG